MPNATSPEDMEGEIIEDMVVGTKVVVRETKTNTELSQSRVSVVQILVRALFVMKLGI